MNNVVGSGMHVFMINIAIALSLSLYGYEKLINQFFLFFFFKHV